MYINGYIKEHDIESMQQILLPFLFAMSTWVCCCCCLFCCVCLCCQYSTIENIQLVAADKYTEEYEGHLCKKKNPHKHINKLERTTVERKKQQD